MENVEEVAAGAERLHALTHSAELKAEPEAATPVLGMSTTGALRCCGVVEAWRAGPEEPTEPARPALPAPW